MSVVEPIIGHLLSKHSETVEEGLQKIRTLSKCDSSFCISFLQNQQAINALKQNLRRRGMESISLETVSVLAESCSEKTNGSSAARSALLREFMYGESFTILKQALHSTSDAGIPFLLQVLRFFSLVGKYVPKVFLARFNNVVPLQLPCFRQSLPYSQRRLQLFRAEFLLSLVTSRFMDMTAVMLQHGFLSQLLEDSRSLLVEGSPQGQQIGKEALQLLDARFIRNRMIPVEKKRALLLGERNILRLLVKALDFSPVADDVLQMLFALVAEIKESPSDYTRQRAEADDEDGGMPNYLLFFLLRLLRPHKNFKMVELATHIVRAAPDLIRPYFSRFSRHLIEDESQGRELSPTVINIAILHFMTNIFRCPLPYHLTHHLATLTVHLSNAASTSPLGEGNAAETFYMMSPKDFAEEVCPQWLGEFSHRLINGSTDLLLLVLVMQMTQAALRRATNVLAAMRCIYKKMQDADSHQGLSMDQEIGESERQRMEQEQKDFHWNMVFQESNADDHWEHYVAEVDAALLSALPKREEFWHRMTQQLHPLITSGSSTRLSASNADDLNPLPKVEFIVQRMLLLMRSYCDVFRLRVSWVSMVPHQLPILPAGHKRLTLPMEKTQVSQLLLSHIDPLLQWNATSISLMCGLLTHSMSNGVSLHRIHHINMSNPKGSLCEWPLLLRLLVWACRHRCSVDDIHSLAAQRSQNGVDSEARRHIESQEKLRDAVTVMDISRVVQWAVHGVTISLGCASDEALLWVHCLRLEALPCFLHLLNHLLQRSLSKAADRVTQEFLSAKYGVLVMAAENFIRKTKEKYEADCGVPLNQEKIVPSGSHRSKKGDESSSVSSKDVWVEDLRINLSLFEQVVKDVKAQWDCRMAVEKSYRSVVLLYCNTPAFTSSANISSSSAGHSSSMTSFRSSSAVFSPAMEQWMSFWRTLASPVLPASSEEAQWCSILRPLTVNELSTKAAMDALDALEKALSLLISSESELEGESSSSTASWYQMNSLCWCIAGEVAKLSHRAREQEALALRLKGIVHEVLKSIASSQSLIQEAHRNERDDALVGFYFLLLCCLHATLSWKAWDIHAEAASDAEVRYSFPAPIVGQLESLLCRQYRGTVALLDRICYASLLTLHYLQDVEVSTEHPVPPTICEGKKRPAQQQEHSESAPEPTSSGRAKYFCGALCPTAFLSRHFQISEEQVALYLTPEVSTLIHTTDMWTDSELLQMALEVPSRLHNTILTSNCYPNTDRSSEAEELVVLHPSPSKVLHELTRAIFPEVSNDNDLTEAVSSPSSASATVSALDPRYFLPLLQCVFSLPRAQMPRRFLIVRCFPYLLRSFSFSDPTLRQLAIATLSTADLPPCPARIIHNFARLKMVQLAEKQRKKAVNESASTVPRLPATVSSSLVFLLKSVGRYDDPLHSHLVRYLMDTQEAFATPCPFSYWLTLFPLDAVLHPLMATQKVRSLGKGRESAYSKGSSMHHFMQQFNTMTPPHLSFTLSFLPYCCESKADAIALTESLALEGLMLLCSILTVSQDFRLQIIQGFHRMCFGASSTAIAIYLAVHGRLLPWLLEFLLQLCQEYGPTSSNRFEGLLFRTVMSLTAKLCVILLPLPRGSSEEVEQFHHSVHDRVLLLKQQLSSACITAKEPLDLLERMESAVDSQTRGAASKKVERRRLHGGESKLSKIQKRRAFSPGGQEDLPPRRKRKF